MKEKVIQLLQDKAFVKALGEAKTDSDIIELINKNGIAVNSMEELREQLSTSSEEVSDEDLDLVSGGRRISKHKSEIKISEELQKEFCSRIGLNANSLAMLGSSWTLKK